MSSQKATLPTSLGIDLVWELIVKRVQMLGGSDEHLMSLIDDEKKLTAIVEIILNDQQNDGVPSSKVEFRTISQIMPKDRADEYPPVKVQEVVKIFTADYASSSTALFEESFRHKDPEKSFDQFEPVTICKKISHVGRSLEYKLFNAIDIVDAKGSVQNAIIKLGFRPAMYEELIAFVEAFPNEITTSPLIATGSITCVNGFIGFPSIRIVRAKLTLSVHFIADSWHSNQSIMAVREAPVAK